MDTPSARRKLAAGVVHQEPLAPGQYMAYRRSKRGSAGSWFARWRSDEGKILQTRLGTSDDLGDADGLEILTFAQAQTKAWYWFKERALEVAMLERGEVLPKGPYTVAEAMHDYLEDAKRRNIKGLGITTLTVRAHILPSLGDILVTKLTKARIEAWHTALAESPRRKTGKVRDEAAFLAAPATERERRARRDTANRILTVLRAALNLALREGRVMEPAVWRKVQPFRDVASRRTHALTTEESLKLLAACPPDFRQLVEAALYTGCRYGELTRLRIRDFDPRAGTVYIETSKSGKPRVVYLSEEAVAWFAEKTLDRSAEDLLLVRAKVKRTTRKDMLEPEAWAAHDQKYYMRLACEAAGIVQIGFHELRHTYASALVNRSTSLRFVAEQLGHSDTGMVERYYGHLSPSALREAIKANAPSLLPEESDAKCSAPNVHLFRPTGTQ